MPCSLIDAGVVHNYALWNIFDIQHLWKSIYYREIPFNWPIPLVKKKLLLGNKGYRIMDNSCLVLPVSRDCVNNNLSSIKAFKKITFLSGFNSITIQWRCTSLWFLNISLSLVSLEDLNLRLTIRQKILMRFPATKLIMNFFL